MPAVIQNFNNVENLRVEITPSDGSNIIKIFEASPARSLQRLGLEAKYCTINTFIKNLSCYSEMMSIPETGFPQFNLTDSETEKLVKALRHSWNEARTELELLDKYGNSEWRPIAKVSIQNPAMYPYKTYNLLDLLTDSLSYEAGDNYCLGVKINDVGWGGIKAGDKLIIRGSYTQEFIVVNPYIDIEKEVVMNKPNVITDEMIGARAIDADAFIGSSNSGTLTQILNSLSHQIKSIIGRPNWWQAPPAALQDLVYLNEITSNDIEDIKDINRVRDIVNTSVSNLNNLADTAITTDNAATFLGVAWENLGLTSNWRNWSAINSFTPSFRLYRDGTLELRGGIQAINPPIYDEIIAQLPPLARPAKIIYMQSYNGNVLSQVSINPDGMIRYQAGNSTSGIILQGRFGITEQ